MTASNIIIFGTASFTLMGGKSLEAIYDTEEFVKLLIKKFLKCEISKQKKIKKKR